MDNAQDIDADHQCCNSSKSRNGFMQALSAMEYFVVCEMIDGLTVREISAKYQLPRNYIYSYLVSIQSKFGVARNNDIVPSARKTGMDPGKFEDVIEYVNNQSIFLDYLATIAKFCLNDQSITLDFNPRLSQDRWARLFEKWHVAEKEYQQILEEKQMIRNRIRQRLSAAIRRYSQKHRQTINNPHANNWKDILDKVGPCPGPREQWHIDHIRPVASFDLADPEQVRQINSPDNLRWLSARENLRKGAKYNRDDQNGCQ